MGDAIMLHRVKQRYPKFTYTGNYQYFDDGSGNWRIKFLSGGTLTFQSLGNARKGIDVFIVGAGAGGAVHRLGANYGYAGGGAGYTLTVKDGSIVPVKGTGYGITIGAGGKNNASSGGSDAGRLTWTSGADGGASSAFGKSAAGGKGGYAQTHDLTVYGSGIEVSTTGGNGGSGGGAASMYSDGWAGGTNGGNGSTKGSSSAGWYTTAGQGQGTTTREFGESGGTLYANGGGAGSSLVNNSGNGGKDSLYGSSGIVVIRNHR